VAALFEECLCVIAGRDHPLATRTHVGWAELLEQRWVMPPPDCYFFEHILRTLDKLDLPLPRHTVESFAINIQFGMAMHGGMLSFGLRSQVAFAPGKEFLVRLPVDLPSSARAVGAVTLGAYEPSPLAQQLVGHIRSLAQAL